MLHTPVKQVRDDLEVRMLVNRILDPERTRPVVVITTGARVPKDQVNPERIAEGAGPEVETCVVGTGRLTYALRDGLPEDADVFGDAARTYPVGMAWHDRPERAPLRFARPDTDLHRLEQQVIADARSAARAAATPAPRPHPAGASAAIRPGAPALRVAATPASLPGAPRLDAAAADSMSTSTPAPHPAGQTSPGRSRPRLARSAHRLVPSQGFLRLPDQ